MHRVPILQLRRTNAILNESLNLYMDISLKLRQPQIFQKSLTKAPLPIQRAMLALQQYVFTRNYIPGKDVVVPDILSRAYVNDCKSEISTEDIEAHMYFVNKSRLIITDKKLYIYCVKTATDESLKLLAKYILHGWPEKQKVETLVKPFCNSREDISMLNGIPLKEKQNYRPNWCEVRNLTHSGYQGIG